MISTRPNRSTWTLLTASVVLGSLPPLVVRALPPLSVPLLLVVRFSVQCVLLGVLAVVVSRKKLERPKVWSFVAGLCFSAYSLLFFESVLRTAVPRAIMLSSLHPVELLVVGWLLARRRFLIKDLLGAFLVILGIGSFWQSGTWGVGDWLALTSSVAFAGYVAASSRVMSARSSVRDALTHQLAVSAVSIFALLPYLWFTAPGQLPGLDPGTFTVGALIAALGASSHLMFSLAQRVIGPFEAAAVSVGSPTVSSVAGSFLFETGSLVVSLGAIAAISSGLFLIFFESNRGRSPT